MSDALFASYDILGKLGSGKFGQVFKGKHKETEDLVAIKIVHCITRFEVIDVFGFEVNAIRKLRHENIVKIRDKLKVVHEDSTTNVCIVFELMDTDLYSFMVKNYPNGMNEQLIFTYMKQMLTALAFLCENGILHRDIKPENLLIDLKTNTIKLCDFGLGRFFAFVF